MTAYLNRSRTQSRRQFLAVLGAAGAAGAFIACTRSSSSSPAPATGDGAANLDILFPTDRVNQVKLTIAKADWQAMLDDMTAIFGARGSGGGLGPGRGGGIPGGPPAGMPQGFPPGGMPMDGPPPDGGPMGGPGAPTRKPMWVAGDVTFNGQTWKHVGIRFKGNSSLRTSWGSNSDRMPFKLDFDQWEEQFPEIKNQRFHGAKQLSLSNNVGDATYMRESLAYDVLRAAALPAARTGFYELILDRGEGEVSLGVYTAIEVVDDTLITRVFGDDKGNIYEAEGSGSTLASSVTQAQIQASFQKENNTDAADWSDVLALHRILNSSERSSDPVLWRRQLEASFDVPVFLRWLAVSAALEHWDTYGGMSHNFYLYNSDSKLTWISWDHNFILGASPGGGGAPFGGGVVPPAGALPNNRAAGGPGRAASLDKQDVTASWPLIRYLMDVPDYSEAYRGYLRETIAGPFQAEKMIAKYDAWSKLLMPLASKQGTGAEHQSAVKALAETTKQRTQAVSAFLGS